MQKLELLDWPQKALGFYVAVDDTPLFMVGDVAVYELAFEEQAINIERRGVHLGRFRHVATKGGRLHFLTLNGAALGCHPDASRRTGKTRTDK
ncbi:hypothetical protein [Paraburkholderia phytofirmans]|uniref:hypothetical protein n=1 Tax=Paraburkholderia phytofirmans TaxID=261302 RepID=UPI0038B836C9